MSRIDDQDRDLYASPPAELREDEVASSEAPIVVPEAAPRPRLRIDEARRRSLRPWAIAGAGLVCLAVVAAGLTSTALFHAKTIEVAGERHLTERQVVRLAGIDPDTNVLRLDENAVRRRLERQAWIADAAVSTRLPATVVIEITERVAVAVAITSDGRVLVAADGTPLGTAAKGVGLPEVRLQADPGAPAPAFDAVAAGAGVAGALPPAIRTRVDAVVIEPDGSITLQLIGGVTVTYGGPDDLELKADAISAILDYAEAEDRALLSIDVTAPAAPTARFVGSPAVVVTPVEEGSTHPTPSPSPDPDASPSPAA